MSTEGKGGVSMLGEVIDARLAVPTVSPWHVDRPRLLDALDTALEVPLLLLSAEPGAGKTVAAAQWARNRSDRAAWLSPVPDDDEPAVFRALLAAALGLPLPDVPAQGTPVDYVRWLRGRLPGPVVLVIDDTHVLTHPEITGLLDTLVRHGGPQLHLMLAARQDPPLPLHRYRLAGQLRELRGPDLAMTADEMRAAFTASELPASALPGSALNRLAARTEGWAAGVRLAALSPSSFGGCFGRGSVGEYLTAEVLDRLPAPRRRLLIETSFLDEVTGPLAQAITGQDDAGETLAELARGNWFVVALDPAGTRFRYHRLLSEVLRYLLRRDHGPAVAGLAARAATCLWRDGDFERALRLSESSGDPGLTASILIHGGLADAFIRRRGIPGGELPALDGLPALDELPALDSLPSLDGLPAPDGGGDPADRDRVRTASLAGLVRGLRSGDTAAIDDAAARLLADPRPPAGLRGAVLLAQACAHFWHGAHDDVDELLDRALADAVACGAVAVQADALGMTACVDSYRSRPRHADDAAGRAQALLRAHPGLRPSPALRLAAAIRSVQRADLAAAARSLRHVSVPASVGADPGLEAAIGVWQATVLALSGQPQQARGKLASGWSPDLPRVHRDILLGEIEISLGRPHAALRHLRRDGGRLAALADVSRGRAHLALDDLDSARQCIRGGPGAVGGRYLLVESLLLDARISERAGDTDRALETITNALDIAREDLVLPFVHARAPLAGLLARHPAVAGRWPGALAGTLSGTLADPPGGGGPMAPSPGREPGVQLTQRERSVLAYLATSLSAAGIAEELYLSVNTVKTHLAAIYRKLGARGRREAVRRARELELL